MFKSVIQIMNCLNCRFPIMTSLAFMDGEYVDLFWRISKVVEHKVYPSRKVVHCKKFISNCFVVKFEYFLDGEVQLACPKE